VTTLAVTRRFDLIDGQWARLEPRRLIDGIQWRVRTGSPWRDVLEHLGSWQAIYSLFRRWQRTGVWARIVTTSQAQADEAELITWEISVDSTIARAHQHAAEARSGPRRNLPAAFPWNPPTTRWDVRGAASPRRST
jgi:transposase